MVLALFEADWKGCFTGDFDALMGLWEIVILPSFDVTVMAWNRREASWREVVMEVGLPALKRPLMLCSGLRFGGKGVRQG